MSDLAILEVAIGLALVYLLLSLAVSGIGELVSQAVGLRARGLSTWVLQMFGCRDLEKDQAEQCVKDFYGLARIQSLTASVPTNPISWAVSKLPITQWSSKPSYIKANTFAAAILDLVAKPTGEVRSLAAVQESIEKSTALPESAKELLHGLINDAGTLEEARKQIEDWYDDAMERVSGWYKRKAQTILLGVGVLLALALNVNSFAMADSLWREDALRSSVVAAAEAQSNQDLSTPSADAGASTPVDQVATEIKGLDALDIPIGWDNPPHHAKGIFGMLGGIAFTALAISLGAPFWFDALNRLVNIRGSLKPKKSSEERAT